MGLNESKGNMYEGVVTWNPLAGKCPHRCGYCSTISLKRFPLIREKYSGELRFEYSHPKKPKDEQIVFVVGQNDLFAQAVPDSIIAQVINICNSLDYKYLFQSKNPGRFSNWLFAFPEKSILCTTIETNRTYPGMGIAPNTFTRAEAMHNIKLFEKHVTIEPIFDFDPEQMLILIRMCHPSVVNIGADSKRHNLSEPSKEKVLSLIAELEKFTVVKQKSNLKRLLNGTGK